MHFLLLRDEVKECVTFLEVFQMCMENAHPLDLFAMIASQVWLRRNKLRMGETVADLCLLNSLAREVLKLYPFPNQMGAFPHGLVQNQL